MDKKLTEQEKKIICIKNNKNYETVIYYMCECNISFDEALKRAPKIYR